MFISSLLDPSSFPREITGVWLDVLRTDRFRIGDTDVSEDPDGLYPLLPGGLLLGVGEGLAELSPGY